MYVYTPYNLFFVTLLVSCVILTALLSTYITVRVKKDSLFYTYIFIQSAFLLQNCAKLLAMVAPLQMIADQWIAVQKTTVYFLLSILFLLPVVLLKYRTEKRLVILSFVVTVAISAISAPLLATMTTWLSDLVSPAALILWSAFIIIERRNIFVELSDLTLDRFMDQINDAVLIFDSSHTLMDINRGAQKMFPFVCQTSTVAELFEWLTARSVSPVPVPSFDAFETEPFEFGFGDEAGTRYLQCRTAEIKHGADRHSAMIITFYDVTENTKLFHELEEKNQKLRRFNDELKNYIEVTCLLENEEEKSRTAEQIKSKIDQSLTEILTGLEILEANADPRDKNFAMRLEEMCGSCRTVMTEIRTSLGNLIS